MAEKRDIPSTIFPAILVVPDDFTKEETLDRSANRFIYLLDIYKHHQKHHRPSVLVCL